MIHKVITDSHRTAVQVDMLLLFVGNFREFFPQFRANSLVCSTVLPSESYGLAHRYINGTETGGITKTTIWIFKIS
jgi:hypothetical protein